MIHISDPKEIFSKKNIAVWLISAFKAGFINSFGFLATGKFVSHVTGFGTQIGLALGHDEIFFGAELFIIPVAFIFGGVVTSLVLDKNYSKTQTPEYFKIQGLITLLIAVVILIGEFGLVQSEVPFDADESYNFYEFILIGLLCFICGLKNSLITWSTFGKIRVTHLTGIATDIGLHLIRTFKNDQPSPRFKEDRDINIIRIFTFASFSLGACLSAILYPLIDFKGFIVVFVISLVMTIISLIDWKKRNSKPSIDSSFCENITQGY
jgi:uncharacterized membrane protein YoaK (UPF0700 family)